MTNVVHSADAMIAALSPELRPGRFVFCNAPGEAWWTLQPLAMFQEAEGISLILEEQRAAAAGIPCLDLMRLITLNVFSSLSGVGLTAAVSGRSPTSPRSTTATSPAIRPTKVAASRTSTEP